MELTEKEREQISNCIYSILENRGVKINSEWDSDFSKEHDFECFLQECEKYINEVENYE